MPVETILPDALKSHGNTDQTRTWCSRLEAGDVVYFPQTPVPIPADDLTFLLDQQQTSSSLHKNIAYKPDRDKLSGVDEKSTNPAEIVRMHEVMRRYSKSIEKFLTFFLSPYEHRWLLDYASFRPLEEKGR